MLKRRITNFIKMRYCLVLVFMPFVCSAWGQTIGDVEKEYKELVNLRSSVPDNNDLYYQKAKDCSTHCQSLIRSLPRSMDDFSKSQTLLKSLYTMMRAAAGYYSQAHKDSFAIDYAKKAVDIAMMNEMRNVGLRSSLDYPNFVYYLVSRTYNEAISEYMKTENAEDLIVVVKYMKEFLNVAEPDKHSRVRPFLERAERELAQIPNEKKKFYDVYKDVPDFEVFAKAYIEKGLEKWKKKSQFETIEEYNERVNLETAREKQKELHDSLMDEYVDRFAYHLSVADMKLGEYDPEHNSYLIESPYGAIVLAVPRANNEAREFQENWSNIKVYNPNYVIVDKKLALSSLTFDTPSGKVYNYNNQQALAYIHTDVEANIDIDPTILSGVNIEQPKIVKKKVVVGSSDVDINIPVTKKVNEKTFAVIIANENYTSVPEVPMAGNDGKVFAQYCEKTLGLPKEHIFQFPDATYGIMLRAISLLKDYARVDSDIRILFYYAGHGVPNEATHDAFLLPIDADGKQTEVCYSVKKLYEELSSLGVESVVVFLDACFSGATGDGKSLMANARGVEIDTNDEEVKGNMIVFSATTSGQTAYPYKEQKHGLFTYFLLKKLQESKGDVTLGELKSFIEKNVSRKSLDLNKKIQTPIVSPSANLADSWQKMKLR